MSQIVEEEVEQTPEEELFEVVYNWGKEGAALDSKSPAFVYRINRVKNAALRKAGAPESELLDEDDPDAIWNKW
jgi:hypothetical protein